MYNNNDYYNNESETIVDACERLKRKIFSYQEGINLARDESENLSGQSTLDYVRSVSSQIKRRYYM